jgi:hypothetical protein
MRQIFYEALLINKSTDAIQCYILRRRNAKECEKNLQNTRSKIPFDNDQGVEVVVVVLLASLLLMWLMLLTTFM